MKKLIFLFAAVFLTAISANVFAQNTGTTPTPGSTFTYDVTDNGNTFAWTVTKGDLTTDGSGDVTFNPLSADGASVDITWAAGLNEGDVYYVHVVETDGNSCSNEKVLKVIITASLFYLDITANQTDACYDGAVAVSLDGSGDPEYDHGDATLTYTVTPTGLGTSTGYSFNIAETFTPATGFSSVPTVTSGNGSIASGVVTVTDANAVTIQFVVTNGNTYDNTTDAAGTVADFNQQIDISNGETSHGVPDNGTNGTYTDNTDVARPHTATIGTN